MLEEERVGRGEPVLDFAADDFQHLTASCSEEDAFVFMRGDVELDHIEIVQRQECAHVREQSRDICSVGILHSRPTRRASR